MGWLSSLLHLLAETMGFVNKRTDLKNAPDVREAKVAQDEVDRKNKIESDVAKKNLEETRKDIAE